MNKMLCLAVLLTACYSKEKKTAHPLVVTATSTNAATKHINYDSCKKAIPIIKKQSRLSWTKCSKTDKEKYFTNAVTNTIAPAWVGTKWDFNGVTEVPQQGSIACGYFVTTVLRDAGLPIARAKMAQCASEEMVKSLVQPKYINRFSNVPMIEFMNHLKLNGFGLYIIGLDNHTGFIYNDGKDIWFIHSSYIGSGDVQKEKAANSSILKNSKYKIIGKISADEKALDKWVQA